MKKTLGILLLSFIAIFAVAAQDKPKQETTSPAPVATIAPKGADLTPSADETEKLKNLQKDVIIARQQKKLLEMQYAQVEQNENVAYMQLVQTGQAVATTHKWDATFDAERLVFVPRPKTPPVVPAANAVPATAPAPAEKDSKQ